MKGLLIKKVTAWMMVAYFLVFIIPPESSFAETRPLRLATKSSLFKEPCHQQARRLLIDLLLWEQITQTKRADNLVISGPKNDIHKTGSTSAAFINFIAKTVHADTSLFARPEWQQTSFSLSRLSLIRYARSGTSPPHFS